MKSSPPDAVRIYYLLNLLFYIHLGFIGATYALFFYNFGISKLMTNVLSSLFMVSVFVMEIPTGAYADAFGYRKTLILAGLFLNIAMLLFSVGDNILIFGIAQILWGVSFAFESGALDAWMVNNSFLTGPDLDKVFIKAGKINNISMIISGLLGGYLANINIALPWKLSLISASIYVILVALYLNKPVYSVEPDKNTIKLDFKNGICKILSIIDTGKNYILKTPLLKYIIAFNMILSFCFSPVFVYWSPYLKSLSNEGFWLLGWIWVFIKISNLAGNLIIEYIPKSGNYRLNILCVATVCVSIVLSIASLSKKFITALIMFLLFEILLGIIQPLQKGYINEFITDAERATILSLDSMLSRAANFLSLLIMGLIGDLASMQTTWLISAGILIVNLIIIKKLNHYQKDVVEDSVSQT